MKNNRDSGKKSGIDSLASFEELFEAEAMSKEDAPLQEQELEKGIDFDFIHAKKIELLANLRKHIKLQDEFNVKFAKQNMTLNTLKFSLANGVDPVRFPNTDFKKYGLEKPIVKNSNMLGGLCLLDNFRKHSTIHNQTVDSTSHMMSPLESPNSLPYLKSIQNSSKFQSPPMFKESPPFDNQELSIANKQKYSNNLDNLQDSQNIQKIIGAFKMEKPVMQNMMYIDELLETEQKTTDNSQKKIMVPRRRDRAETNMRYSVGENIPSIQTKIIEEKLKKENKIKAEEIDKTVDVKMKSEVTNELPFQPKSDKISKQQNAMKRETFVEKPLSECKYEDETIQVEKIQKVRNKLKKEDGPQSVKTFVQADDEKDLRDSVAQVEKVSIPNIITQPEVKTDRNRKKLSKIQFVAQRLNKENLINLIQKQEKQFKNLQGLMHINQFILTREIESMLSNLIQLVQHLPQHLLENKNDKTHPYIIGSVQKILKDMCLLKEQQQDESSGLNSFIQNLKMLICKTVLFIIELIQGDPTLEFNLTKFKSFCYINLLEHVYFSIVLPMREKYEKLNGQQGKIHKCDREFATTYKLAVEQLNLKKIMNVDKLLESIQKAQEMIIAPQNFEEQKQVQENQITKQEPAFLDTHISQLCWFLAHVHYFENSLVRLESIYIDNFDQKQKLQIFSFKTQIEALKWMSYVKNKNNGNDLLILDPKND